MTLRDLHDKRYLFPAKVYYLTLDDLPFKENIFISLMRETKPSQSHRL